MKLLKLRQDQLQNGVGGRSRSSLGLANRLWASAADRPASSRVCS
jgi:hypothetical protein